MFLGTSDLVEELPSIIVENFEPTCIKNACYNLRLGNEVYITNAANKKKEILDDKNPQIAIEPGQFALLITKETVQIPNKRIAFITLRFSQKIKGLINVSGFHIDPGFHGKIVFSVYNAGPTVIHLDKDKEYFTLWLAELKQVSGNVKSQFQDQTSISDYIDKLGGTLASPNVLLKKTEEIESTIKSVEQSFKDKQTSTEQSVKEKQDNINWKLNLFIGIVIALALKSFWDWSSYKNGYENGKSYKLETEKVKEVINSGATDSLIYDRVIKIIDSAKH